MKFFWGNPQFKANIKILVFAATGLLAASCATKKPSYGKDIDLKVAIDSAVPQKPEHRFFLVGDAGYVTAPHTKKLLSILDRKLKRTGEATTLLFLGDNIYPEGMPLDKDSKERKDSEATLQGQIDLAKSHKGKTWFIPGNHDWYHGFEGLLEQEKFIEKQIDKGFLPGKGCAIKDKKINDNTTLITVDSQWFIEDWDNYPNINDECNVKTREDMFVELEDQLNKNQDKTIILAIHHPIMTNGSHGGHYSAEKQFYPLNQRIPLPVLGSMINLARKASGYSTQDIQSRVYGELAKRIKAMIQDKDNVIVVSGHDHNLQYIYRDNIHQIISGAGTKSEAALVIKPLDFTYGYTGYAMLDIYDDCTARVWYYGLDDGPSGEKLLFTKKITDLRPEEPLKDYPDTFPKTATTSIYTPEMTKKGGFYRFLFGEHYRYYYSLPVEAQTATLPGLYGGVEPERTGGGNQSLSLRLIDKGGKEYKMRSMHKSATRFLQAKAFKTKYMGNAFENTFAEKFLLDFYTTAHPYMPYVAGELAESAGIYHTNPQLFYIPKHDALGRYNDVYGGEMYMLEEHPADEHKDAAFFGKPDAIEGTDDVLKNIRKSPKYTIDEQSYIKARLFDMLVGDWDRHEDQWRWARYDKDGIVVYKPIPRDRDQVFPKYDGALLSILMNIPALRHMKTYKEDLRSVKWFNREAYPLDLALITKSGEKEWLKQADELQQVLTDAEIEKAFMKLPKEVQDSTAINIKNTLKARRGHLKEFATEYYKTLAQTVLLAGTDKKEKFVVTRTGKGMTEVAIYSLTDNKEELIHQKEYNIAETKELWLYGLDDDDIFEVKGSAKKPITVRLLGGLNNDTYTVEDGRNVKVYDFKSKKNNYDEATDARLILTDDYETNTYDYRKPYYNVLAGYPSAGYNPDDGVKLGGVMNYTVNSFNRRPYSQRHSLKAHYIFATGGFEFAYRGTFMNVASRWNFAIDALYTSPNFAINYFGMGNETKNIDDDKGMNYNRVKQQTFRVAPSFFRESRNGSFIQLQAAFETIEVENTMGRFIDESGSLPAYLFEHRQFAGINAKYSFANYDNASLPALGMSFYLHAGWKASMDEIKRNFPHADAGIGLIHRLTTDDRLVFATYAKGTAIFNNNFEFYQGAVLGGEKDLRSFRRERFTGRYAAFQTSDLRFTIGNFKNSVLPFKYGILGGFDYGRVWLDDDNSKKWHNSVGGGAWINGADTLTAKLQWFYGEDGGRVSFGFGFAF
ncbi:MAG: metallophosphoesterase [Flavobacterium sp.]